MEYQIKILYNFFNYLFLLTFFIGTIGYFLAFFLLAVVTYMKIVSKLSISMILLSPFSIYYLVSVLWVVIRYFS